MLIRTKSVILLFQLSFCAIIFGQVSHFTPAYLEYSDNPYLAMNLTITTATLDGIDLQDGDEIGVFDGEVCVGSGIVDGTIEAPDNMLAIVASAQESDWPAGTGFTSGNSISYRFWDANEGKENTSVQADYVQGDEVFTASTCSVFLSFHAVMNLLRQLGNADNVPTA